MSKDHQRYFYKKSQESYRKGMLEQALKYIDQAIAIAEQNGVPDFLLRRHRAGMLNGPSVKEYFIGQLPVELEAAQYFESEGDAVRAASTYITYANTAYVHLKAYEDALEKLDTAEQILKRFMSGASATDSHPVELEIARKEFERLEFERDYIYLLQQRSSNS